MDDISVNKQVLERNAGVAALFSGKDTHVQLASTTQQQPDSLESHLLLLQQDIISALGMGARDENFKRAILRSLRTAALRGALYGADFERANGAPSSSSPMTSTSNMKPRFIVVAKPTEIVVPVSIGTVLSLNMEALGAPHGHHEFKPSDTDTHPSVGALISHYGVGPLSATEEKFLKDHNLLWMAKNTAPVAILADYLHRQYPDALTGTNSFRHSHLKYPLSVCTLQPGRLYERRIIQDGTTPRTASVAEYSLLSPADDNINHLVHIL